MKLPLEQALRDLQHFGEEGGVVPVIDVASTSTFLNPGDMERVFRGELEGCYLYSRHSNPTVNIFGRKLATLEGAEAGLGTASGMAAVAAAILQLLPKGGHVVSARTVYGGTYALFANLLPKLGFEVSFVDSDDAAEIQRALRPNTKVVYVETMSNPLLTVPDFAAISAIAHKHGAKLVVDNTFAPMLVSPLKHGADVVVHSCTKYISGASDLIAGAVVGTREFIDSLIDVNHGPIMLMGPVMDPRVAHELYQRLDHLALRMRAHSQSAEFFARRAAENKISVVYPGLESHVHHARLKKILNPGYGFGGMVTLAFDDPRKAINLAKRLQDEKFGLYAVSLGFSRTLITCPALSTSSEIPEEERLKAGLAAGLLRLSVGYVGDDATLFDRFLRCYREVK